MSTTRLSRPPLPPYPMGAPSVAASSATITPLFSAFCVGLCEKGKILLTEVIKAAKKIVDAILNRKNNDDS